MQQRLRGVIVAKQTILPWLGWNIFLLNFGSSTLLWEWFVGIFLPDDPNLIFLLLNYNAI